MEHFWHFGKYMERSRTVTRKWQRQEERGQPCVANTRWGSAANLVGRGCGIRGLVCANLAAREGLVQQPVQRAAGAAMESVAILGRWLRVRRGAAQFMLLVLLAQETRFRGLSLVAPDFGRECGLS